MNQISTDSSGYWYFSSYKWDASAGVLNYKFQVSYIGTEPPAGRCFSSHGGGVTNPPQTTKQTGGTVQPTTSTPWSKFQFLHLSISYLFNI